MISVIQICCDYAVYEGTKKWFNPRLYFYEGFESLARIVEFDRLNNLQLFFQCYENSYDITGMGMHQG